VEKMFWQIWSPCQASRIAVQSFKKKIGVVAFVCRIMFFPNLVSLPASRIVVQSFKKKLTKLF
jgi:hypothetical protein